MSPILATRAGISAAGYGMFGGGAPATAFESIATATGTGSSGTITFSSIPSTYQHLQIRGIVRDTSTGTIASSMSIRTGTTSVDTGTNYARHRLSGNGSTVTAQGFSSETSVTIPSLVPNGSTTADIVGVFIIDIHDYAASSKYKTIRALAGQDRNGVGEIHLASGLWMSTSSIGTISLFTSNNFTTTSTFALYGIKGA